MFIRVDNKKSVFYINAENINAIEIWNNQVFIYFKGNQSDEYIALEGEAAEEFLRAFETTTRIYYA
jgi:hypothetical protein